MIRLTLAAAARLLDARLDGADGPFVGVSTDSRTLAAGNLFVALPGEKFDGHDHIAAAKRRGAAAALVSRPVAAGIPTLQVADTRLALGGLAAHWRRVSPAKLIAVTGSNGKTTVKEMIAAILAQRGPVLATQGNLNNEIGLPLTLLGLADEPFAVAEMGANHPGEIAYLSGLARPDIALLNNAGRAHLEGFGSLEGVARAKAEIVQGLSADGTFVYNADSPWAPLWRELAAGHRTLGFGLGGGAEYSSPAESVELVWGLEEFFTRFPVRTPQGELEIVLSLGGRHNRMNALAAVAAAQAAGATNDEIQAGLAAMRPVKGRLQPLSDSAGIHWIDDSYNANPDSVGAAIEVLAGAPGRRLLLLGELAELGDGVDGFYDQLGAQARRSGIDRLYGVGAAGRAALAFGMGGRHCADREQLIAMLQQELNEGDYVLVKGSRRAGMERVIAAFVAGLGD